MDNSAILRKMEKAAQSVVDIAGHKLTIRRPTKYEMAQLSSEKAPMFEIACRFVVGWDFTEADLITSGGEMSVPFDKAIWRRWLEDNDAAWSPLFEAVMSAFSQYSQLTEGDEKN